MATKVTKRIRVCASLPEAEGALRRAEIFFGAAGLRQGDEWNLSIARALEAFRHALRTEATTTKTGRVTGHDRLVAAMKETARVLRPLRKYSTAYPLAASAAAERLRDDVAHALSQHAAEPPATLVEIVAYTIHICTPRPLARTLFPAHATSKLNERLEAWRGPIGRALRRSSKNELKLPARAVASIRAAATASGHARASAILSLT